MNILHICITSRPEIDTHIDVLSEYWLQSVNAEKLRCAVGLTSKYGRGHDFGEDQARTDRRKDMNGPSGLT